MDAPSPASGASIFDSSAPPPGDAADREERAMLERALRDLPPEQREVMHMKVYEQFSFQQIADALGISPNTAAGGTVPPQRRVCFEPVIGT